MYCVIFASHQLAGGAAWLSASAAFGALSLCASAIYIVNDLTDLKYDRGHPEKRKRPFASGELPAFWGAAMVPPLLLGAFGISLYLPLPARSILAAYTATALAYSFFLKRVLLVDVFTLAGLYTSRILLGAAATHIACSSWLLGYAMFFFCGLAFAKRVAELRNLKSRNRAAASGRAYAVGDLPLLTGIGVASSFSSAVVLSLYIHSPESALLYRAPQWLWVASAALLYWQCRLWLFAGRGAMEEDPVLFATRDRVTYGVAFLVGASGWWATGGSQNLSPLITP